MAANPTLLVVDLASGEPHELPRDTPVYGFPHAYRIGAAYRVGGWSLGGCLGPDDGAAVPPWAAALAGAEPLHRTRGHVVLLPQGEVPLAVEDMGDAVRGGVPARVAYVLTTVESVSGVRAWLATSHRHPTGRPPTVTDLLRARRRSR